MLLHYLYLHNSRKDPCMKKNLKDKKYISNKPVTP
ncbi:hypothetical protein BF9343_0049 [Bacteroides fragilis NCTC 9343]|uniref:Uncharacterized protein n=1 Tax=Bacteroides fragilis (strain ATCC 25285 / DSM 2151 / CCUG 4856 / JCM 11019 / LMG 10263 / NCTC 9343 / Onslow / VPI 2553 / EN-2) TaxID=272559 RepID=Q5LJ48_BACFN|nr:hypothetical protein BF9343_0049 [Bacteroides fragilis NCTC 9343]